MPTPIWRSRHDARLPPAGIISRFRRLHVVPLIHGFLDYVAGENIKSFVRMFRRETLQFGHIFVQWTLAFCESHQNAGGSLEDWDVLGHCG